MPNKKETNKLSKQEKEKPEVKILVTTRAEVNVLVLGFSRVQVEQQQFSTKSPHAVEFRGSKVPFI